MIEIRPFVKVLGVPWFYPEPEPAEPEAEKEIRLINSRGEVISVSVSKPRGPKRKPWTPEEDAILIERFASTPLEELAEMLPERTMESVRMRSHRQSQPRSAYSD